MSDEAVMESAEQADVSVSTSESTPETTSHESSPAATPPAESASQGTQSVWSAFRSLPDFKGQDDVAIARRLYAAMEREKAATSALANYQQYIPYAQQYLKYREPFEQWLSSQQGQQRQPAPSQPQTTAQEAMKRWWNPPEIRESYKQYLVKDESGREVISPEAPIDARHALYEYQKYKADFAQKFLTNPEEALGPMIQEIAQRQADELIQGRLSEMQQHQYVSSLEQENKDWLYDANGEPTEEGLAAQQYIEQAASMGIASPEARWEYATKMIERDLLDKLRSAQINHAQRSAFEAGLPQQNAPAAQPAAAAPAKEVVAPDATSQAQRDIEFLRKEASRNPSRSAGEGDPRVQQAPLTFEQRLARQLARDGVT